MTGWFHYKEGLDDRMVSLSERLRWQDGFIIRKVKIKGWFHYQEG